MASQAEDENLLHDLEAAAKRLSIAAPSMAATELKRLLEDLRDIAPGDDLSRSASEARVVDNLIRISKSTRALLGIRLAEIGYQNGQDEMLLTLDEEVPISIAALASRLAVRPSTVSKMVDRFHEHGLVARLPRDPKDTRLSFIKITKAGLEARSKVAEVREALERELAAALGPGQKADIDRALVLVGDVLRTKLARLR